MAIYAVPPRASRMYHDNVVNQYTTVGGTTRTHDSNGNLTDDGTYLFGYDFQNRLVELKNKSTSLVIATYRYDALGRRVEKAVVGGATTRYILDGVQVVEEYDGANTWQARYVYEDGIDQPRCMDRADIADVNGNSNTTEVLRFHYHQQALGSVTEITQPSGAVVEWVTYDVYGQPTIRNQSGTVITQSAVGNPYLYTGREFDPESGLFFYRARTYDPQAGRFLQRDPDELSSGPCSYSYCSSQPTTWTDPSGMREAYPPWEKKLDKEEQRIIDRIRELQFSEGLLRARREPLPRRIAEALKNQNATDMDRDPEKWRKLDRERKDLMAELQSINNKLRLLADEEWRLFERLLDLRLLRWFGRLLAQYDAMLALREYRDELLVDGLPPPLWAPPPAFPDLGDPGKRPHAHDLCSVGRGAVRRILLDFLNRFLLMPVSLGAAGD